MPAIILAAARGLRLQQDEDQHTPKSLLSFGGMSLLERHLRLLRGVGDSHRFEVADVTGAPWIEIDFPNDVARAALDVLPQLRL
jgi:choline kinase